MKKYNYRKIDAFAAGNSTGNPAACLYLKGDDELDEAAMLDIARQHKGFVSEVVYCFRSGDGSFSLRYFSSECEVEFCGHGTIACMYVLLKESPDLLAREVVRFQTRTKGEIAVFNEIAANDAVFIAAPAPRHLGTGATVPEVAAALGMPSGRLATAYPVDCIDAGLRTLIVPVARLVDEVSAFPDQQTLRLFCENNDIDIVLIFSLETACADRFAHTRVFAPRFGYLEDPATGSGNSALGHYLLKTDCGTDRPLCWNRAAKIASTTPCGLSSATAPCFSAAGLSSE